MNIFRKNIGKIDRIVENDQNLVKNEPKIRKKHGIKIQISFYNSLFNLEYK